MWAGTIPQNPPRSIRGGTARPAAHIASESAEARSGSMEREACARPPPKTGTRHGPRRKEGQRTPPARRSPVSESYVAPRTRVAARRRGRGGAAALRAPGIWRRAAAQGTRRRPRAQCGPVRSGEEPGRTAGRGRRNPTGGAGEDRRRAGGESAEEEREGGSAGVGRREKNKKRRGGGVRFYFYYFWLLFFLVLTRILYYIMILISVALRLTGGADRR